MHKKMSLFRRKKASKVFPVKISTMDAELEFSLDYKVRLKLVARGRRLFDGSGSWSPHFGGGGYGVGSTTLFKPGLFFYDDCRNYRK